MYALRARAWYLKHDGQSVVAVSSSKEGERRTTEANSTRADRRVHRCAQPWSSWRRRVRVEASKRRHRHGSNSASCIVRLSAWRRAWKRRGQERPLMKRLQKVWSWKFRTKLTSRQSTNIIRRMHQCTRLKHGRDALHSAATKMCGKPCICGGLPHFDYSGREPWD